MSLVQKSHQLNSKRSRFPDETNRGPFEKLIHQVVSSQLPRVQDRPPILLPPVECRQRLTSPPNNGHRRTVLAAVGKSEILFFQRRYRCYRPQFLN